MVMTLSSREQTAIIRLENAEHIASEEDKSFQVWRKTHVRGPERDDPVSPGSRRADNSSYYSKVNYIFSIIL